MNIGDTLRSDAARCFAFALNPWASSRDRLRAWDAVPVLERMAVEADRWDLFTARGADLQRLAVLYGVTPAGEDEALRSSLVAKLVT